MTGDTVTIERDTAKAACFALDRRAADYADWARNAALRMQGRPAGDPGREFWHRSAVRWTAARYDAEAHVSAIEAAIWPLVPRTFLTRWWAS